MGWYKKSLRLRTLEEAQEDYARANMDDVDFLVTLLKERKRLMHSVLNLSNMSKKDTIMDEIGKLKNIWDNYTPEIQFFALNKYRNQERA